MPDYDNRSGGVLFENDKGDNPRRPDYKGSWTDANGKVWDLACWVKEGRKGKFLSLKASEKREKKDDWPGPGGGGELDDDIGDIPF